MTVIEQDAQIFKAFYDAFTAESNLIDLVNQITAGLAYMKMNLTFSRHRFALLDKSQSIHVLSKEKYREGKFFKKKICHENKIVFLFFFVVLYKWLSEKS